MTLPTFGDTNIDDSDNGDTDIDDTGIDDTYLANSVLVVGDVKDDRCRTFLYSVLRLQKITRCYICVYA